MKDRRVPHGKNVYWALSTHDRPEGTPERAGEIPGRAGQVRKPGSHRDPERGLARGASVRSLGATGVGDQRAIALRRRGASSGPALHLPRKGSGPRRGGSRAPAAGQPSTGRSREGRDDRGTRPGILRGLGSHALRGVRTVERRRPAGRLRAVVAIGSEEVNVPVLVHEVAFLLRPRREGWVIDGTVGMGGHAEALLETTPAGVRLLGLD